jgi:hypothetical protein
MWDLWWTKLHWGRFFSKHLEFPLYHSTIALPHTQISLIYNQHYIISATDSSLNITLNLKETYSTVHKSDKYPIHDGIKHGDAYS